MRDLRPAVGVSLLVSIVFVLVTGCIVRTSREVYLLFGGFAGGLVTACLVDAARRLLAERDQPAPLSVSPVPANEEISPALDLSSSPARLGPEAEFPKPWGIGGHAKPRPANTSREAPHSTL